MLGLLVVAGGTSARSQGRITAPKDHFGFEIGDDFQLATYTQFAQYWQRLDRESDRMQLSEIGKTAEGRPQLMAIITSPVNFKKLDRLKEISRRLALAEGLTDAQARALAGEGKAVVWIDGGIHATEVVGSHQLIDFVYRMVSQSDAETMRILNDVVVLVAHANPDGMELVSQWYMREPDPLKRSSSPEVPRLYQKYAGHDNNRDFYMSTQPESENINRVLYREWFPQIVYDHHQTGPEGTVMFAPPFRDPFNYVYDPLIPLGIDLVGAAMHGRFAAEAKPGVTMRRGSTYSTWWNGGLRTTPYFHNMIGLLTETIGHPTPIQIPFVPERQLATGDLPFPIAPQRWHFRQSMEYSWTANRAVLDIAARFRETFLFNIYQMGRNAIRKGSTDTWTISPSRLSSLTPESGGAFVGRGTAVAARSYDQLRRTEQRDPRGYIIPSNQPDFLTAVKFVNVLLKSGIAVERATAAFSVGNKSYAAGSYVVKTAQAFRPFVLDMFEPQDHPHDFAYPGGPPVAPYDSAGWTVAYQMGIAFDRILESFDGPFARVSSLVTPDPGHISGTGSAGFILSHQVNDAFVAVNRLLAAGERVLWSAESVDIDGSPQPPGTMFIPAGMATSRLLQQLATDKGLSFTRAAAAPQGPSLELKAPRIAVWDRYGGSIEAGWLRFVLEQFEFSFDTIYPQGLDAGNLIAKYDVIVFPTGSIPVASGLPGRDAYYPRVAPSSVPEEFRNRIGAVTTERTIPELRRFLEAGGTVVTMGSATNLATHLKLPLTNHLVERTQGTDRPLPRESFYVPGSILRIAVDNRHPLAFGAPRSVDVYFDDSPVFSLAPSSGPDAMRRVGWFEGPQSLRSGWAWGQRHLDGGTAVAEARIGLGTLVLLGPEVTFRAQPHGTFRFLFNSLFYGQARRALALQPDATRAPERP